MKIGLYLQDIWADEVTNKRDFNKTIDQVKKAKLDLFVFPEICWTPFKEQLEQICFFDYPEEKNNQKSIGQIAENVAKLANCAVIICGQDKYGVIWSCYANPWANDVETKLKFYAKHVATVYSALELLNYPDIIDECFQPIMLKGYTIGHTICYDSTFPLISRAYGIQDVDLIINSTGGHVDYKKWSYYQKVRAIENNCSTLCTMADHLDQAKNSSCVFGYDQCGKKLDFTILGKSFCKTKVDDKHRGVYVFSVDKRSHDHVFNVNAFEIDEYINQIENVNKNIDWYLEPSKLQAQPGCLEKIADNIYLEKQSEYNIIICKIKSWEILLPERVASLLYHSSLKKIDNKRYVIFNEWEKIDDFLYESTLSSVLKVRAAENFCAVVLNSPNIKKCIQVGNTKNIQIVQMQAGRYGLDLKRMSGPEALWQNKSNMGMRKSWRDNYEVLLQHVLNAARKVYPMTLKNIESPIEILNANAEPDTKKTSSEDLLCLEKFKKIFSNIKNKLRQ